MSKIGTGLDIGGRKGWLSPITNPATASDVPKLASTIVLTQLRHLAAQLYTEIGHIGLGGELVEIKWFKGEVRRTDTSAQHSQEAISVMGAPAAAPGRSR